MEDKKKVVALSDDALDNVAGGFVINQDHVIDQDTGAVYPLLTTDRMAVFMLLAQLGSTSEAARVEALRAAGYIA